MIIIQLVLNALFCVILSVRRSTLSRRFSRQRNPLQKLTDCSGRFDKCGVVRDIRVQFGDEHVDDPAEEEEVQEDGQDAGDLEDPTQWNVVHPTT